MSADVSLANFDGIKFELIALVTGKKSTEWKFGIFIPKTELCQMAKTFLDAEILDGCWLKDVDYSMFSCIMSVQRNSDRSNLSKLFGDIDRDVLIVISLN